MTYYKLTCEVPGGFGNETIYDKTDIPWDIKSLHIRFDGWMGADIMTISSAVLITKKLQKSLGFNFTGFSVISISFLISQKFSINYNQIQNYQKWIGSKLVIILLKMISLWIFTMDYSINLLFPKRLEFFYKILT